MARNWLATQAQPSFKGVRFSVRRDRIVGGRKIQVHEYPNSEFWDNEDLGRRAFSIEVEAFVDGDDADVQAQNLLAACSSPGLGLLVLPNRPQQNVRCLECIPIWDEDEQGKFEFSIRFAPESRTKGGIVSAVELANTVAIASDNASDAITQDFSTNFNSVYRNLPSPVRVPSIARLAAATSIGLIADAMDRLLNTLVFTDSKASAQARFGVRQIRENAKVFAEQGDDSIRIDDLVFVDSQTSDESAVGRIIADTLKLALDNVTDPKTLADSLGELMTIEPQELNAEGIDVLTVRAETLLTGEIMTFVRRISIVRYGQAISRTKFASRADAVTAKALIAPAFANEIATADNPAVSSALQSVATSAANYVAKNGALLPKIVHLDTAMGLPAAVLAAMLYNDASRDEDLWERNGPELHPLSLPTSIEALAPDGF